MKRMRMVVATAAALAAFAGSMAAATAGGESSGGMSTGGTGNAGSEVGKGFEGMTDSGKEGGEVVQKGFEGITEGTGDAPRRMKKGVEGAAEGVGKGFEGAAEGAQETIEGTTKGVKKGLEGVEEGAGKGFEGAGEMLKVESDERGRRPLIAFEEKTGEQPAAPSQKLESIGKKYSSKASFEKFSKKLKLTPEQKEKIRPILNEEVKQIKEVYADKSLAKEQQKGKEMQIIEAHRGQVKEVLSPEQQQIFDKMVQERKAKATKKK